MLIDFQLAALQRAHRIQREQKQDHSESVRRQLLARWDRLREQRAAARREVGG